MLQQTRIAACCALWIVAVSSGAISAQLLVSQDGSGTHTTIQGALNAASYGDVVYVRAGTYDEGLTFKNGVALIGSGSGTAVIRHGYGFEPVVHASHASSGRIEGFSIERTGTTLPAPAVLLESTSITISACTVTGAQESGIVIVDATSSPTIEGCTIRANGEHGIWVRDGARASVIACELRENGGSGVLLTGDAEATVHDTRLVGNDAHGIALADSASAILSDCDVGSAAEWGIELLDGARIEVTGSRLAGNLAGGVRVDDDASACVVDCVISGGETGVTARGRGLARVEDSAIRGAIGVGFLVQDTAAGGLFRTEVDGCGSHGVNLASQGSCSIDHVTVVRNSGSGILVQGPTASISNTIVAYNGAIGIAVDLPPGSPSAVVLSHNDVWVNGGGEYEGVLRRTSDVSAPPSFVDLAGGDLALRPNSPCIDGGVLGATIGAYPDPSTRPMMLIELAPTYLAAPLGIDLSGRVRLQPSPFVLETVEFSVGYRDSRTSFTAKTSLAGRWGSRISVDGQFETSSWTLPFGALTGRLALSGVLDGIESWLFASGTADLSGSWFDLVSRLSRTWPSDCWIQEVDLRLGATLVVGLTARMADFSPELLVASLKRDLTLPGGTLAVGGSLVLGPNREASLVADWTGDARSIAIDFSTYLSSPGYGTASLLIDERAASTAIALAARFADYAFDDGSITLTKRFGPTGAQLTVELGINAEGFARCALRVVANIEPFFARSPNLPPIPAFSVLPADPQAGDPVRFDASGSDDPDGEIHEFWWDFGDGTADLGESVVHVFPSPGSYDVALTVADDGGTTTLVQPLIIWEANSAPVAAFIWEPVSDLGTRLPRPPRSGDSIRLDASESYDPSVDALDFHWDLDSDGSFDVITNEPITVVPPMEAGSHPVTLRVINRGGRSDAIMHAVIIAEPKPPQAGFSLTPASPSILDPVRFTDRSTDVDGEIAAWEWTFGDNHSSREAEPTHQYSKPGEYPVSLSIIDSDGLTDSYQETITIARIPEITPVDDVWILAIGISDYDDVADLQFGRADGIAIVQWALDAGVPPDHVRLLTDRTAPPWDVAGLETRAATLVNVRESLGWLRQVGQRDDLVMVFFSGHGYQGLDDGSDERDGVDEFFVLLDTLDAAVDDTALRDDEFGRFLDRLTSEHVLIFFDGCYSGGLARSLPSGYRPTSGTRDLFRDFSLEGRLIFSAAGEAQEAFESPALGHGVFTHFVLDGLRGSADLNGDAHVTAWELYEFLLAEIPPFVRAECGADQVPRIVGEGDVRVLVAGGLRHATAAFSFEPAVPFAGGPIAFRNETTGEHNAQEWTFGDGTTSADTDPTHTYEEAGDYRVALSVADGATNASEAAHTVTVAAPGRITTADDGLWIVSLGSRNGIRVGDLLFVLQGATSDPVATIEVIELLDADTAACRITDGETRPAVGDAVRPATQRAEP